jgi:hypothetical protein
MLLLKRRNECDAQKKIVWESLYSVVQIASLHAFIKTEEISNDVTCNKKLLQSIIEV